MAERREATGAQRLRQHETAGTDTHDQMSRRAVQEREQEQHGGIKWGSAFFGWLTATGMMVLLTAIAAAAGAAFGVASGTKPGEATKAATSASSSQVETVGIIGGIILLVVAFLAYFCGGYVAGRMARFNGLKQGLGVWLWAILVAVLIAVVGAVAGSQFNILQQLGAFPRIPVGEGTLTTGGIVALVAVVAATLGGALLGGITGMRFHRKVDKTGLGA